MVIRLRTAFFVILGAIIVWFLYLERGILTPFIVAAIFAYIFNPIVSFLSSRIKLPRAVSVIIIWAIIISILSFGGYWFVKRAIAESVALRSFLRDWIPNARAQIYLLPEFARPTINEALSSLQKTLIGSSISLFAIFPQAISGIISFFIFFISSIYFLHDGRNFFDKFLLAIPKEHRIDAEILLRKINVALGDYLRGQLLVILVSFSMFLVFFTVLGVRFSFILALISGFLEVIPLLGPYAAGALAVTVVLLTGASHFDLSPFQATLVVVIGSFLIRQVQDYLITPRIMGRVVRVHPLVVLFAIIAGGNVAGILGMILAVPTAAVVKVLLEYSMDKVNDASLPKSTKNT